MKRKLVNEELENITAGGCDSDATPFTAYKCPDCSCMARIEGHDPNRVIYCPHCHGKYRTQMKFYAYDRI